MSMVQTVYSTLQQEGYRPRIGEGGVLSFRYYGQEGWFRTQQVGAVTVAELACRLPRPAPTASAAQQFSLTHPLARLGAEDGRALLSLTTMMIPQDIGEQVRASLQLLDQYVADVVFASAGETSAPGAGQPAVGEPTAPAAPAPAPSQDTFVSPPTGPQGGADSGRSPLIPPSAPESASSGTPAGWEEFWPLMHERYQPLAQELARRGIAPPEDVQVDMLQHGQVKGTAIMLWGSAPNAVVVCEPGQPVPPGYLGDMWLKHLTVEQVAANVEHNLRRAGLL